MCNFLNKLHFRSIHQPNYDLIETITIKTIPEKII